MRFRRKSPLWLGFALFGIGCTKPTEPIIPLQIEATQYYEANRAAISALADKLEADGDIQSLECSVALGIQRPIKGVSRADGTTVSLSEEKIEEYWTLVKDAHICDGSVVRGGVIFDLFEIDKPNYKQSIQLLRVVRDGDELCMADHNLEDLEHCVVSLDDHWQLVYYWNMKG